MVRLTDRPDMTLDVYRGRKTTMHNGTLFKYEKIFTCRHLADYHLLATDSLTDISTISILARSAHLSVQIWPKLSESTFSSF